MSFIKKNGFSKVAALVLSATMVFGSTVTAFATDSEPQTQPGSGNILAYVNETYVVPTSLKVALNPGGLAVNIRYKKTEDTTVSTSKTYYTYDSTNSKYVYVADPAGADIATLYEADQSTDQIVSFNYGIVNESTKDKKVKITLDVAGEAASAHTEEGLSDITFVDSAADATAKTSPTAETGAGFGELKMYLAIAPSTAAPKADTYAKNTAEFASGTTYYTWDGTNKKYVEATGLTEFAANTQYFVSTDTIGTEIKSSELVDVDMDAVAAAKQTGFAAGETAGTASAEIGYKLGKAAYAPKKGEIIDWSTTQAQLEDKVELTTIGGTAAFTITGTMNTNADWTKAKATVLTITPTYDVKDADGTETTLTDAGYNQMQLVAPTPEPTITDEAAGVVYEGGSFYIGASENVGFASRITIASGDTVTAKANDHDAVDVTSIATVVEDNGKYFIGIPFDGALALGLEDEDGTYTFVATIGTTRYTATITF